MEILGNPPVKEGYIPFKGYKTWYRIVGESEKPGKLPLICLHGGPGVGHDYLEPLEAMAKTGRRVIFYDQLGCGKSDQPDAPEMWTVELFIEELNVVRAALGLDQIHLLGQSWGGMLAMEYTLTQPKGLASLIVASSPTNMDLWVKEANRLREMLPPEVQQTLLKHEAAKTTDTQEYLDAVDVFYKRHVCRIDPFPDYVKRTFDNVGQVYLTMNGPSEFHVIGTLKEWNIVPRLPEINVPTLITSGRYDEATPMIMEEINQNIPGSKWVLFENSAHMAHAEEAELYMKVLDEFLVEVENQK